LYKKDYCTNKEELEAFMKENLKPKRYVHSLGVQDMARELAGIWGADTDKAEFAGRYHDIAKCFDREKMNGYVREFSLGDQYLDNNALAHSKVAAEILRTRFGVNDGDILDAVRSHTTGRDGMSLLEEIVYVADAIEDNRNYEGIKELQDQARTDLDGACLYIMDWTIDKIQSEGRIPDNDTIEARDYIRRRRENL
jgi:predicted HD superfamily hydrolase involved in NAD metabolism